MKTTEKLKAGSASITINNELGTDIQAATALQKVKSIRDDLEANALWLESGDEGLLFISCDLVGLDMDYVRRILPDLAKACGVPQKSLLLGTTHNHAGPAILGPSSPDKPLDEKYLDNLFSWLCKIGKQAVESAIPAKLAYGVGSAQIGYNRRCCWQDGSHSMHGDSTNPDFRGLEGSDDPQHTSIFITDLDGNMKAILYNNTTHPTTFYAADFLSADWPGLSRRYLRELFGDIPVLFFNGTSGDIAQDSQYQARNPESPEIKIARNAHLVVGETLRLYHHASFTDSVRMLHKAEPIDVILGKLSDKSLNWARGIIEQYRQDGKLSLEVATAWQTILFDKNFRGQDTETITMHAVSLDNLAFVTAPCELFTHFGTSIKARSPFDNTAIFGHVHGFMGYCPTTEAVIGGGWGGDPTWSVRWEESAGYKLVDHAVDMLHRLKM